jgi:branched-chain amino acid transport system substrate-binding protein
MKIRLMTAVGAGVLAVAMAGCGNSGGGGASSGEGVYRVAVLGGLGAQGILADNSATSVNAAKASVAFANDNGGVNGKKVVLDVLDDKGDPTVAVSKLREEIAKNKPDLVMNSGPSTIAEATLPILNQNHILSFNIGPTATSSDPKVFPLNFDISVDASQQIEGLLPYLKEQGDKSVAVIHGNSAYGETFGKTSEDLLSKGGIKITGNEEYDVAALDMTPQLAKLKAGNPDVLLIDAYGAPLGYLLKGITKLGWDVKMIGNTSVSATSLTTTMPPDGLVGTDEVANLFVEAPKAAVADASDKPLTDAVQRIVDAGGVKSSMILGYNFDTLPLIMAAADAAKSTDPKKLAAELIKPAVQDAAKTALIETYGFTADRHAPQGVSNQYKFVPPSVLKNGQFTTS